MKTILVKLTIMLITGPYSLNKAQTTEMYQDVRERLKIEAGVDLKLKKLRRRSDIYKSLSSLNSRLQKYLSWKAWLLANGRLTTKELTFLILPPMPHTDGKRYIAGYASSLCTFKKFKTLAASNAQMTNAEGLARYEHSKLAMLHELSHLIGATHQDFVCNVMHPAAMACLEANQSFWAVPMLPVTINQIRHCVG